MNNYSGTITLTDPKYIGCKRPLFKASLNKPFDGSPFLRQIEGVPAPNFNNLDYDINRRRSSEIVFKTVKNDPFPIQPKASPYDKSPFRAQIEAKSQFYYVNKCRFNNTVVEEYITTKKGTEQRENDLAKQKAITFIPTIFSKLSNKIALTDAEQKYYDSLNIKSINDLKVLLQNLPASIVDAMKAEVMSMQSNGPDTNIPSTPPDALTIAEPGTPANTFETPVHALRPEKGAVESKEEDDDDTDDEIIRSPMEEFIAPVNEFETKLGEDGKMKIFNPETRRWINDTNKNRDRIREKQRTATEGNL
jgi:hypothetical protein